MNKLWYLLVPVVMLVCLFFVRLVLPSQVDDVSPGIFCSEDVLNWADVYYVIPKFDGVPVDREWCEEIKKRASLSGGGLRVEGGGDKELAMHGVVHSYREFGVFRDVDYVGEGVEIFEECFGFEPERFKPPQLVFSEENDWMRGMFEIDLFWNQVFHKVYHCGDTGVFPNWFVRVF